MWSLLLVIYDKMKHYRNFLKIIALIYDFQRTVRLPKHGCMSLFLNIKIKFQIFCQLK